MRAVVTNEGDNFKKAKIDSGARKVQLDRIILVLAGQSESVPLTPGIVRSLVIRNLAASPANATVRVLLGVNSVHVRPQLGAALPLPTTLDLVTLNNTGTQDAEVRLVVY